MTKVFIVSKESQMTRVLEATLSNYGFIVECASHEDRVNKYLSEIYFNIILLDFNFYKDNGREFYQKVNDLPIVPPVIMLGECFEEIQLVKMMYQNMDDYILKPFGISELKMIINRQLERRKIMQLPIIYGDLKIDVRQSLVFIKDRMISLGMKELEALTVLTKKAGKIVVNDKLFTKDRIENLRRKLKEATNNCLDIKSVSGLGYKLVDLS